MKKVRDILSMEEIKWKVVLSLVGWNCKELFAERKLIIGFCLKLSLHNKGMSLSSKLCHLESLLLHLLMFR